MLSKRTFAAAIAIAAAAMGPAAAVRANELTVVYGQILDNAVTMQQKYSAVLAISAVNDPELAPLFAKALEDALLAGGSARPGTERELYDRLIRILVKYLGEWKYTDSAPFVMRAMDETDEPLTKSDALIALGTMRATEYAEKVSLLLRNLNFEPTRDTDSGEKIAYGAVICLERLRDPRGFQPLFYASDAWYGKRVREQAARSLPNVLADPTDAINELIRIETPDRRLRLLDLEIASSAPADRKASVAATALSEGIKLSPRNKAETASLVELRKAAMNALVALKVRDGRSAQDLAEAYRIGDVDERLVALRAMGADGSPSTVAILKSILVTLNDQQRAGLNDETRNRLARAAIQNAAIARSKDFVPVLTAMSLNEAWSNSVMGAASDALKAIQ